LSTYAPQTGCDESEKDSFWENMYDIATNCPPGDDVIICGDLNGHVGSNRDGYHCHGGNGFGERNADGVRILDFAEATGMQICNTFFRKRPTHLVTYSSG